MTGLFYNEYPPATSVLRSLTFGRLAGTEIAQNLGKEAQGMAAGQKVDQRADSMVTADAQRPGLKDLGVVAPVG